jgi:hypothetical protein
MATSLLLGSRQRRKKRTAGNERTAVMLLPCQFRLLNGDTNTADVDGMDFSGNRPTTISATTNYTTAAIATDDIGSTSPPVGNAGMDVLGNDTPLGTGRPDYPGQSYTYSLMMLAKVSPPAATNITYAWGRVYQGRDVVIAKVTTATNAYWYVKSINTDRTNSSGNPIGFQTGYPTPHVDTGLPYGPSYYGTSAPNTNNNVISLYDNPGLALGYYTNINAHISGFFTNFTTATNLNVGDYAYVKRNFTYYVTNSVGSASAVASVQMGNIRIAQKTGTNGVIANDWSGITNIATTTNIPDCSQITTNEISAIVSPSTNAIVLDPHVNDPDPNP